MNKVTERKNSKNSQENICSGVLSLIKSQAEKITCAGGCRLKAQYQHQIVDAFVFFYFAVYNKIQAFCTIYAVCSYSSLKKVIWRVIVCILPISYLIRGGSRTAATSKMERFILDVTAVLDPPLLKSEIVVMVCEENPKAKDTRISAQSGQGRWIIFLDLDLKQALFYVEKMHSRNTTYFTYCLNHIITKKNSR